MATTFMLKTLFLVATIGLRFDLSDQSSPTALSINEEYKKQVQNKGLAEEKRNMYMVTPSSTQPIAKDIQNSKLHVCPYNSTVLGLTKEEGLKVNKRCSYTKLGGKEISSLRIEWQKFKGATHYIVRFSRYTNCTGFNITSGTRLSFSELDGFQKYSHYWVSVDPYPRNYPAHQSKLMEVGACPWKGVWSAWQGWEPLSCSCNKDIPRRRTKKCVQLTDKTIELAPFNCKRGLEGIPTQSSSCYITCRLRSTPSQSTATLLKSLPIAIEPKEEASTSSKLGIIFGGCAGVVVMLSVILTYIKQRRKKVAFSIQSNIPDNSTLYVSYWKESPKSEKRLLSLITYISSFGIQCTVDLLCQVEINNIGGLPNWIPQNILQAEKILVVLSKAYVEVLNSQDESDKSDQVCKLHTEFSFMKTMMYHSCLRRVPDLVIVLEDGVKYDEIPNEFRGRPYCFYPKNFKITEDENCRKLMGLLLSTEPLQIITEFKTEVVEKSNVGGEDDGVFSPFADAPV